MQFLESFIPTEVILILERIYFNNTIYSYILAGIILSVLLLAFSTFKIHIIRKLEVLSRKTKSDIDDEIVETIKVIPMYFYWVIALYVPIKFLSTPEIVEVVAGGLATIVIILQVIRVAIRLLEYIGRKLLFRSDAEVEKNQTIFDGLRLLVKIIVWSIGLLMLLSNIGINVSSLVASLGIGGIAIALAAQSVLGDIFSAFSIYIDKPFQVGDYIDLGGKTGTIKKIGLKNTRIKTLQGQELIVPNTELTNSHVENYKRMTKRRVAFSVGVTYDTPSKKLEKIPDMVSKVLEKVEGAELDRVHFMSFGDFSLNYDIVYFVNSREYTQYADRQQQINLALFKAFEKAEIEFAFPTQTIYAEVTKPKKK